MGNFIFILIFIAISWVLQRAYAGYVVPSKWLFKNKMIVDGLIAGILLAVFVSFVRFNESDPVNAIRLSKSILFGVLSLMILSFVVKIIVNKALGKIMITDKIEGEEELMIDSVVLMKGDVKKPGKLTLTTKRIRFKTNAKENICIDFYFSKAIPEIELTKKWGIPDGIKIKDNEKEMKINVKFPKYWEREILRTIIKKDDGRS